MTAPRREQPTIVDLDDAHMLGVSMEHGQVRLTWFGPPHADLDPDTARSLAHLLRSYAQLAEPANEPGG